MARHLSFDDPRVGKGKNDFFKVTGTAERPQRVAYIPGEATMQQLVPSEDLLRRANRPDALILQKRAAGGDTHAQNLLADMQAAQEEVDDIRDLEKIIKKRLTATPPSAQLWTNEMGVKVVLYPKTESDVIFWINDVGPVKYLEGLPPECLNGKDPETVYGCVVLEYEMDDHGDILTLPPDQQTDLGGGHKLTFRYQLKSWAPNDFKSKTWKEAARRNPLIFSDFDLHEDRSGKYPVVKFGSPGPALWRQDPLVMQRIIREARKHYAELHKRIARHFTMDEILEMFPKVRGASNGGYNYGPAVPQDMEQIDFTKMLGGGSPDTAPALGHVSDLTGGVGDESSPEAGDPNDFAGLIPDAESTTEDPLEAFFPNRYLPK